MWNSFEKALEKKIRRENSQKKHFDKFTIIKTVQIILDSCFGNLGRQYIEVVSMESGRLKIKGRRSAWRSELELRKEYIKDEINGKLGQSEVDEVVVIN